jgi:hypothetical protein
MHDTIHAAIAAERTRDLLEMGDKRRATRRVKRERAASAGARAARRQAQPQPQPQPEGAGRFSRTAAILRLRPWVM